RRSRYAYRRTLRRSSVPARLTHLTTSNADDGTLASVASSSSLHLGSGAPLTYQPDPLSATSIPYFIIARRIARTVGVKLVVSMLAWRRTGMPIGGRGLLVSLLA